MASLFPDTTVICITAGNIDTVRRFVLSVRQFYPDLPVIVGHYGDSDAQIAGFLEAQKVVPCRLEAQMGVVCARSACLSRVETDYILVCDDNLVFTEKTDLRIPQKALYRHPALGAVTGMITDVENRHGKLTFQKTFSEKNMYLDRKNAVLISIPVFYTNPGIIRIDHTVYYRCDIGAPFVLMRKALFSENSGRGECFGYEIGHKDFYLSLKYHSHWEIAFSPDFSCQRVPDSDRDDAHARDLRDEWERFSRKWGVRQHLDIGSGFRRFDTCADDSLYREELVKSPVLLPVYKEPYLRILANGECVAGDIAPHFGHQGGENLQYSSPAKWVEVEKAYRKYTRDKATVVWKLARPFMKIEQALRKRVSRLKQHESG